MTYLSQNNPKHPTMHKTLLVRYTLTTLSALTLIPLTYSLITRKNSEVSDADAHPSPAIHRHVVGHSCSHCTTPVSAARQAAQARKIAAAGLLWEKSSSDPAAAEESMTIINGMPLAADYQVGARHRLTLADGSEFVFDVKGHYVHTDGTVAVDAILPGTPEGKLHLQWNDHDDFFLGQIEYTNLPVAYEITRAADGVETITRRSIDQIVCAEVDSATQKVTYGLPAVDETLAADASVPADDSTADDEGASLVPALNSYPSADAVLYLDFDGEVVKNTSWGSNITADATNYSTAKITDIWKRVAADMEAFDLNVTTDEAVYLSTAANRRIRCIITPSSEWYQSPAIGGVAKRSSFTWSGDTPCWVFSDNLRNVTKYIAECCSHEVGHTLGLAHDGKTGTTYYAGHGTGAVGWAPIMGNGYYKTLTQWSEGEYTGATNTQDDLTLITSNNGFGYRSDDHSNKKQGATVIEKDADQHVSASGTIERRGDTDVFSLESGAGSISLNVTSAEPITNLDIEVDLYDAKGNLLATANPATQLNASVNTTVSGGTYYLHVRATSYGSADTGSSTYGSLGSYDVEGQMAAVVEPIVEEPTPYEQTVAALSESERGLDSDPDDDGLTNLVEHVMGTDPSVANTARQITSLAPKVGDVKGFDFLINLPSDLPSDAQITIEASCDLGANNWDDIAYRDADGHWSEALTSTVTEEVGTDGNPHVRIAENSDESRTCRFIRLRFELVGQL